MFLSSNGQISIGSDAISSETVGGNVAGTAAKSSLLDLVVSYEPYKRLFDIIGVIILLVPAVPVMAVVAILVALESRGPVVYRQKRLTKDGLLFTMYKFRTMRADAEKKTGAVWAAEDDPRVTRLGRFMRKTRLDELPQLFNVLLGDMSLIGPRPERPEMARELAQELANFDKRLMVKAGLTGLAQVSSGYAANVSSYKRKLALDLLYVDRQSFVLDLKIALKTIMVVLTGNGAR